MHILIFTQSQLDWLAERIPGPRRRPFGGRSSAEKGKAIHGIFWILDNGAKWKDLPPEFGSKSTVHHGFQRQVREEAFKTLMRDAGRLVQEQSDYPGRPRAFPGTPEALVRHGHSQEYQNDGIH
ncbi:MAG: transposase [Candidatus Hydrogenedentales bacterium]